MTFPFTIGRDAVGEVVECGPAVPDAFEVGRRVWTNSLGYDGRDGALAELVVVPRGRLYAVPDAISSADMAALCHPAATAALALFRYGHLQAGRTVLVIGGGGNIGSAAIRFARHAGAVVVATARPDDHAHLRSVGADQVLDYREPLDPAALAALGVDGIDLVVDTAGINDTGAYVPLMRRGGRIVLLA